MVIPALTTSAPPDQTEALIGRHQRDFLHACSGRQFALRVCMIPRVKMDMETCKFLSMFKMV